jgi:hypothetical protein
MVSDKRHDRREYLRKWKAENRERCFGYQRKYRERNPEKVREAGRKYAAAHRERVSALGRKVKYGLSEQDYSTMMAAQGGHCAICGNGNGSLCVDHDHASGTIRGLLCVTCNAGLGSFRDKPALLQNAIGYLKGEKK